jgi:hypothetical protein
MVCLRNISINTLHKGNSIFTNNNNNNNNNDDDVDDDNNSNNNEWGMDPNSPSAGVCDVNV